MKKILKLIAQADKDYRLIDDGDTIAVGVSGGKDSTLLLLALNEYQKNTQKKFNVIGIHIKLGFEGMDFTTLSTYLASNKIEFHLFPSQVAEILKIQAYEDGRLKCSLCSKFKKAIVISRAKELNCNKVAFAHHSDDAVETLFLNAIYGGKLSTFLPKMHLSESNMMFIRPLIYVSEEDILSENELNPYPIVKSTCPMDGYTKRQDIKEMLNSLYTEFPTAKGNFLKMLHNEEQLTLWNPEK